MRQRSRLARRVLPLGLAAIGCLLAVPSSPVAAAGKTPAGLAPGAFYIQGVSVVPGSKDAFVYGTGEGGAGLTVRHLHDGHWSDVPLDDGPGFGSASGVAAGARNKAWIVGYNPPKPYLVELSNGAFHNATIPAIDNGILNGVSASSAGNAWAVGQIQGTTPAPLLLHWNGVRWSRVAVGTAHPRLALQSVSTTSPHNVWVAGAVYHRHHNPATWYLFHWNGTTWRRKLQSTTVGLGQIAAQAPNRVWATDHIDGQTGELGLLGVHGKWSSQIVLRGSDRVAWNGITVSGSTGYAVGSGIGDGAVPFMLHLENGTWHLQDVAKLGTDSQLQGISMSSKSTLAVGNWYSGNDTDGYTTHNLVESPDGSPWHRVRAP